MQSHTSLRVGFKPPWDEVGIWLVPRPSRGDLGLVPRPSRGDLGLVPRPSRGDLGLVPRPSGGDLGLVPRPSGGDLGLVPRPSRGDPRRSQHTARWHRGSVLTVQRSRRSVRGRTCPGSER